MSELTHLSLFSGIGGLDLAAEWAGIRTVGQCEWADYPTKVLEKHWPDVTRWKDIRTLTGESFYERTGRRTVDIISGGFPCQPFSVAGKQRGKEDDRYLWPEMVRVIKELRPTWVVGENVAGIIKLALPDILYELEACGYRTRTFLIPACAIGARHRRYRVAIVGYSEHDGSSPAEIARGIKKAGRGKQKRKETSCEFTGAGKSGNGKSLADSHTEWKLQPPGCKQDIRNGIGLSSEDVANTNSAGLQAQGAEQQTARTSRTSENAQYANCARRKEQYASAKSDKERFAGWGCDEGDVCNAPGKRLSDRSSEPLGGQRTQEQEPERPDSNVSDPDNRSRDVRRHRKLSAVEEIERKRCNIGGRAQEHESGERRSTESVLGRVADGISSRMDGDLDFFINHYWDDEPDIQRVTTGINHRVDRLKCLGNAVVPQQFYPIFRAIIEIERSKEC